MCNIVQSCQPPRVRAEWVYSSSCTRPTFLRFPRNSAFRLSLCDSSAFRWWLIVPSWISVEGRYRASARSGEAEAGNRSMNRSPADVSPNEVWFRKGLRTAAGPQCQAQSGRTYHPSYAWPAAMPKPRPCVPRRRCGPPIGGKWQAAAADPGGSNVPNASRSFRGHFWMRSGAPEPFGVHVRWRPNETSLAVGPVCGHDFLCPATRNHWVHQLRTRPKALLRNRCSSRERTAVHTFHVATAHCWP